MSLYEPVDSDDNWSDEEVGHASPGSVVAPYADDETAYMPLRDEADEPPAFSNQGNMIAGMPIELMVTNVLPSMTLTELKALRDSTPAATDAVSVYLRSFDSFRQSLGPFGKFVPEVGTIAESYPDAQDDPLVVYGFGVDWSGPYPQIAARNSAGDRMVYTIRDGVLVCDNEISEIHAPDFYERVVIETDAMVKDESWAVRTAAMLMLIKWSPLLKEVRAANPRHYEAYVLYRIQMEKLTEGDFMEMLVTRAARLIQRRANVATPRDAVETAMRKMSKKTVDAVAARAMLQEIDVIRWRRRFEDLETQILSRMPNYNGPQGMRILDRLIIECPSCAP